jgi:hypothetical protein
MLLSAILHIIINDSGAHTMAKKSSVDNPENPKILDLTIHFSSSMSQLLQIMPHGNYLISFLEMSVYFF